MGRIDHFQRGLWSTSAVVVLAVSLASCAKSPEEKSKAWLASAKAAIHQKDYDSALIDLSNALQTTPNNAEAYYQMGLVLLQRGEPARAAQSFKSAIQFQPTHTDARGKFLELLLATDDAKVLPAAEEQAKVALEQRPNDPDIRHSLAVIRWRQGKTSEAAEQLKQVLKIAPGHLRSSTTLAQLQRSAVKDLAEAEQTMRQAVDQASGSAESRVAFGRFYLTAGQPQAAEAQFRQAVSKDPNNARALTDLARLLIANGKRDEAGQILRRLSDLPDKSFRTAHAVYLFESGQPDAAISELKRIVNGDSSDRESQKLLIDFYLRTGKKNEAQEELKNALNRNRQDPDLLEHLSRLHILEGRFEEARKTIADVLRSRPGSASAHYIQAQAQRGLRQLTEARQELEAALKLDPRLVQARVEWSQMLRNSHLLARAFEVIDGAPAEQKQNPAVVMERNWVLIAQGRYAEAEPGVKKALTASREPAALIQAGLVALQQNRREAGRALLEEALQSQPENLEAVSAIALSLASEGRQSAAGERLATQAARAPKSASVQFALGSWLEQSGNLSGARKAYEAAVAADSVYHPASVGVARMEMLQGRWEDARKRLQGVLQRDKRDQDALLALGMVEEGTGQYPAAIETYRALLGANPDHVVAKNNLAMRLAEDPATAGEALVLAQQLDRAAPNNPEIKDTVGWVYFKNGIHDAAIRYLESAAIKSKSVAVKYHLAIVYFAAKKRSLGLKTLADALALDPKLPEAALARKAAESAP